jgi:aldose 1-epimerase
MTRTSQPFGTAGGVAATLYTLTNARGSQLKVTDFGATVTELHVPDREGKFADVVLGFDDVSGYAANCPYFGATIGRVANRIRDARFELGEKDYALEANNGVHHLHGGQTGWDKVFWQLEPSESNSDSLTLSYHSPDGDGGYPGAVNAKVCYRLTDDDCFAVTMTAETSALTLVNMAHHTYWNLAGQGNASILEHELRLNADEYTPGDPVVPDGTTATVRGTPFDFSQSKRIGADIERVGPEPLGYDHNFVVRGAPNEFRPVAELYEPTSGRCLELWANQPGVQLYSGNFLDGSRGKKGSVYPLRAGVCLETQGFPNAVNVPAWRSQVVLAPGTRYEHRMEHRFSTRHP